LELSPRKRKKLKQKKEKLKKKLKKPAGGLPLGASAS